MKRVTIYYDNGRSYTARRVVDTALFREGNTFSYLSLPKKEMPKGIDSMTSTSVDLSDVHTIVVYHDDGDINIHRIKNSSVVHLDVKRVSDCNKPSDNVDSDISNEIFRFIADESIFGG